MADRSSFSALVEGHPFSAYRFHARLNLDIDLRSIADAHEVDGLAEESLVVEGARCLEGAVSYRRHEFESDVFGVDVFHAGPLYTDASVRRRSVTEELSAELLAHARGDCDGSLVVLRVDADDIEALVGAQSAGFTVCEASTTWIAAGSHAKLTEPGVEGCRIEVLSSAQSRELPAAVFEEVIRAAGRSFDRSHFHTDPGLSPKYANQLYERWAYNLLQGDWAAANILVWSGSRVVGFLGFSSHRWFRSLEPERVLTNSLGLSLPDAPRGVATAMNVAALRSLPAISHEVGTQLRNPLMRVLSRSGGYSFFVPSYTLHGWAG